MTDDIQYILNELRDLKLEFKNTKYDDVAAATVMGNFFILYYDIFANGFTIFRKFFSSGADKIG